MQNKPNTVSFPGIDRAAIGTYIDGFGVITETIGGSLTNGRVLAYLLLLPAPASLDQIARHLEVSKSSVSVAARTLERAGAVRRIPQRGSRRVLYEAMDTFESLIEAEHQHRTLIVEKLRQGLAIAPPGLPQARLERFIELYQFSVERGREALQEWRRLKPDEDG